MLHLFRVIFSFMSKFLTGGISSEVSYEIMLEQFFIRLYDLLGVIFYGLSGMILVIVGFFVGYFDLLAQYDGTGMVRIGAMFVGCLALVATGLILLYNIKKNKFNFSSAHYSQLPHVPTVSPLEEALSVLILDFVQERQLARETAEEKEKKADQSQT